MGPSVRLSSSSWGIQRKLLGACAGALAVVLACGLGGLASAWSNLGSGLQPELAQHARQSVMFAATLMSAMALVLLGAFAWWLRRAIVGPLKEAAAAVQGLAEGDFSRTLRATGREDRRPRRCHPAHDHDLAATQRRAARTGPAS